MRRKKVATLTNRKTIIVVLVPFLCVMVRAGLAAQTVYVDIDTRPVEEWNQTYGGADYDEARSVRHTSDGGCILTGYTYSFGAGSSDFWLVKTEPNGTEQWTRTFGGSSNDSAYSVEQTSDGGYILAGYTYSLGAGNSDFWLVKTDPNGDHEWNQTFGGASWDTALSVQQTSDGGYIAAGYTYSFGEGNADFWLVKTEPNGSEQWTNTFGGAFFDSAYSVRQTSDGGYIVAGETYSFGPGNSNYWLLKTDPNGSHEWDQTFGGAGRDTARSVRQTSDGGYIVAGETRSFGAGNADFWLVKTDPNGVQEWTRTFGGSASDTARSVQQTFDGGYIVAGETYSAGAGSSDFALIKTEPNGAQQWGQTFGGQGSDCAYSVHQTSDGGCVLAGATESFGAGDYDFWLVRLGLPGDGSSWADAYSFLQDALADANSNPEINEIRVAEGTYYPDANRIHAGGTNDRDATFQLISGVTVKGGYAGYGNPDPNARNLEVHETVLSGDIDVPSDGSDNSYHVVTGSGTDGNAVLDGFSITAGNANGSFLQRFGGGMFNNVNSSPTVTNCRFTGNAAVAGGGMFNGSPAPGRTSTTVVGCTFTENSAVSGAGMGNYESDVILINCIFTGNSAIEGGGMYNITQSNPKLVNCMFCGNQANRGAGLWNEDNSSPIMTNCTLSGNVAPIGGGMANVNSGPLVINSIFWGNTAGQIGNDPCSNPFFSHCDIAGCGGSGPGWNTNLGTDGGGNADADPLFVREPNDGGDGWGNANDDYGDLQLTPGSPCIDAGNNNAVPPDIADLDGDANTAEPTPWDLNASNRFVDGDCDDSNVVDMGAYELAKSAWAYAGDLNGQCDVDFADFAILALAWLAVEGESQYNPLCDIGLPADSCIDWCDLNVLADNWLAGK
jgi:uncharacterized delta-60 repeat protein